MLASSPPVPVESRTRLRERRGAALRLVLIGAISFLTLVDLFAAQALLPALVREYGLSPATMGVAINASTFGMAAAGLALALFGARIDRRRGVVVSLALLAIPTALLATMPPLPVLTALRVAQGLCMASAFTLTLGHLTERCSPAAAAGALAAYVTGNVASNLLGRLAAASLAGSVGLAATFWTFAALNLLGAVLAWQGLARAPLPHPTMVPARPGRGLLRPALLRGYAVGFLILFAFIGTFTYVNDVLVHAPLAIAPMALGLVYLVFLPALLTTPLAGRAVARQGPARAASLGLVVAVAGTPLLLVGQLQAVLVGLALIGAGTFFAQAVATGSVGQLAGTSRASAGALYLAAYYLGGLAGSAVIGRLYVGAGWPAAVAGIAVALLLAVPLVRSLGSRAEAGK